MIQRFKTLSVLMILSSCNTNPANVNKVQPYALARQDTSVKSNANVDNDFNQFVEYFSSDSLFQIERTAFPIKVVHYDVLNDKDSIIYINRPSFEKLDFRTKRHTASYDQWEQNIAIDSTGKRANIEIRRVDNGIMVDYMFENRNGKWMFISVYDAST